MEMLSGIIGTSLLSRPNVAEWCSDFLDNYGDVLYNVYGSTKVSWATTAGRPPLGTKRAVLDQNLRPVPRSVIGRIFASSHMLFRRQAADRIGGHARYRRSRLSRCRTAAVRDGPR